MIDGKAIAEAVRQELKVEVAELKQKHGIDYDCHASYRFVEK